MKKKDYRPRVTDAELRMKLESSGALLIEGAKWCGKTTSAQQAARTVISLNESGKVEEYQTLMRLFPKELLGGEAPVLLDEWQLIPQLWDAVRYEVDQRSERGQFILTGSAVPADMSQVHHSGAGRIARMKMRPMSLFESGESSGEVSLADLFAGDLNVTGKSEMELDKLAFLIARGGWPGALDLSGDYALQQARNYFDAIVHADISRVDGVRRGPMRAAALLRSYARMVGTQAKLSAIAADMRETEAATLSVDSIDSYLTALENIFVIEEAENWSPRLRARTAVRSSRTRYFTDPSIAVAAFDAGPRELIHDLSTMGLLFENMAIRDLRVYASALHGDVHHFLDKNGLEIDAIIRLRNGKYGLVEMKLGAHMADEAAKTLLRFAEKIDTKHAPAPSFLMVLIGVGTYAYRRDDGVLVVPLSTLRP